MIELIDLKLELISDKDLAPYYNEMLRTRRGRAAVDALGELRKYGEPNMFEHLLTGVLSDCKNAAEFTADGTEEWFRQRRSYITSRDRHLSSIEAALRFMRDEFPTESTLARMRAGLPRLEADLAAYVAALRDDGGHVGRRDVGPLFYPHQVLDRQHTGDLALNGLLIRLVYRLRNWTDSGQACIIARGTKMPRAGRPCYKQAALFATAALGRDISAEQARDHVRDLVKTGVMIGSFDRGN